MVQWLGTATGVHYVILVVAALFLLYESRHQGLFYDDWTFVVADHPSIWAPHVGHWSTVPMLLYLGIRNIFGLDNFLPFAIPVIIAQLGLATLIWRIMLKAGVAPWIATAASALICFLGAGGENILWAFQVGFMGAIALSLIVMLLLMRERFGVGETIGVIVLSILALATSGTSLPMLVGAGVVAIVYRGFWKAVLLFVPGVLAYGIWYVVVALHSPSNDFHATSLFQYLTKGPPYILSMLAGGTGNVVGIAALGEVVFGVVVAWSLFRLPTAPRRWTATYACLLAAVLFAALTAYSRLNLDSATASRYVFMVTVLFLPMAMLALSTLRDRLGLPVVGFVMVIALVVGYNFTVLMPMLAGRSAEVAQVRQEFSAAMDIIKSGQGGYSSSATPAATWAPQVTMAELKQMMDRGWLHPTDFDEAARLTVQAALFVQIKPSSAPLTTLGCVTAPANTDNIDLGSTAYLQAPGPNQIQYTVTDGANIGRQVTVTLAGGWNKLTSTTGNVRLLGSAGSIRVCPR
ncbi:hypothetical protein GCM10027568_01400 [Humibacter soli]